MSLRLSIAPALAAVWLSYGAPPAVAQEPVPTRPAAQAFKLGALELVVLRDGALAVPNNGSVFGRNASPAAVAKVLDEASALTDNIRLDIDGLLIRMPGHVVLIDTGFGPAGHGVLRESLARARVSADDITDVLITHSHTDHVGGLVDADGRSVFPKATIRMSANEWAFMQRQTDTGLLAAAIRPQVETFEPGRPIVPGITPLALYGHTPGHVVYEIASQGQKLRDIGDTAHSSIISLAKPDWTIQFDTDKAAGARQRRHELQRLAATHELIFAPHFPFPGMGRIEQTGDGFSLHAGR
jgi:glyoxylase-like metal-dependent hydrolase (beta-lactamase superfamily II)